MPDGNDRPRVAVLNGIGGIDAKEWDACAGRGANPFVAHAFLEALERSGSATAATGWHPRHLVARDDCGKVVGALPLYLKEHSFGEYVFDWAWAEAYQRAGGRYYPKLQCAVPFTPVNGPRLMASEPAARDALAGAMVELAGRVGASSAHATFVPEDELPAFEAHGFMLRLGYQYHWENRGYRSFDDFLAELASRKRKQVRKERDAVARQALSISTLVGADVKARHWDVFHRFLALTIGRKWGSPYLTRAFFEELSASKLGEKVVLVWVEDEGRPLAAAFNMLGADTLYGRNWAAPEELPLVHFEACYYRAIDFAIRHGLARVEAGAQGEHKMSRGYLPTATWSAHWIADPGFARAVAKFLDHERPLVAEDMAEQAEAGPFRQSCG